MRFNLVLFNLNTKILTALDWQGPFIPIIYNKAYRYFPFLFFSFFSHVMMSPFHIWLFSYHALILMDQSGYNGVLISTWRPSWESPAVTNIIFLHCYLDFLDYFVFWIYSCPLLSLAIDSNMKPCTHILEILLPCFAHVLYSKLILSIVLLSIRVASLSLFYWYLLAISELMWVCVCVCVSSECLSVLNCCAIKLKVEVIFIYYPK